MTIYHMHHIIPKHAGGSDDPSNLIKLTVEEHAEAHRKLWEEHGRWQDELAWKSLSGMVGKDECIRESMNFGYRNWWDSLDEIGRETHRKKLRHPNKKKKNISEEERLRRISRLPDWTGRKHSEESKMRMAAAAQKRKRNPYKRGPTSAETKEKIRQAMILARKNKFWS